MSSASGTSFDTVDEASSSRATRLFETHSGKIVALLLLALFAAALTEDVRVPLWNDELLTLLLTRQPAFSDVLDAIRDGADSQPPLYDLIVRSLRPLIANDALRVRLPSTIGFFVMCACVFVFARKRMPAIYAILAMLLAARATWVYSTLILPIHVASEGRSYGLVLGCVGIAIVCWQAAVETGQRRAVAGLAVSLTAAIALHYFSVFVLCALFAGELVLWWNSRRLDLPRLVALALPPLVLLPHLPLIRAAKPFVKYFWSKAYVGTLWAFYVSALVSLELLLVFVLALFCSLWLGISRGKERQQCSWGFQTHEWVVGLVLIFVPEFVILGSLLTIKIFVARYVLWSMIGLGIFVTSALFRMACGNRVAAVIVMLPLLVWCGETINNAAKERPALRFAGSLEQGLGRIPLEPKPIVITDAAAFMELWFYSDSRLRNRLVYLISPELERFYLQYDTNSLLFSLCVNGRLCQLSITTPL